MKLIKIEPEKHKPGVILDSENHSIKFYGISLPEDALGFFMPIFDWLNEYLEKGVEMNKSKVLNATFSLIYFNTASHRAFLEIFQILKKINDKGIEVKADWCYEEDDNSMLDSGHELSEIAELKLNFIEVE